MRYPTGFFRGDLLGSERLAYLAVLCLFKKALCSSLSFSDRFGLRYPLGNKGWWIGPGREGWVYS